jgi:hypothetical protein
VLTGCTAILGFQEPFDRPPADGGVDGAPSGGDASSTDAASDGPAASETSAGSDAGADVDGGGPDAVAEAGESDACLPDAAASGFVLFDEQDGPQRNVFVVQSNGCNRARVTSGGASEPALTPDGGELAYTGQVGAVTQIVVETLATHATRQVTSLAAGASQPAWSSDGRQLAFTSGRGVYLVDATVPGAMPTHVFDGVNDAKRYQHPAFTADNRGLYADDSYQIDRISIATKTITAGIVGASPPIEVRNTALSPSLQLLATLQLCDGQNFTVLVLAVEPPSQPAFAPCVNGMARTSNIDGSFNHIAFGPDDLTLIGSAGTPSRVVVISGITVRPITTGANDERNPIWAASFTP